MSFALQSLMSEYIVKNKESLKPGMVNVPADIDDKVGFLKLQSKKELKPLFKFFFLVKSKSRDTELLNNQSRIMELDLA